MYGFLLVVGIIGLGICCFVPLGNWHGVPRFSLLATLRKMYGGTNGAVCSATDTVLELAQPVADHNVFFSMRKTLPPSAFGLWDPDDRTRGGLLIDILGREKNSTAKRLFYFKIQQDLISTICQRLIWYSASDR